MRMLLRLLSSAAVVAACGVSNVATATDACVQNPPPPNYTPTCQDIGLPANRHRVDAAFLRSFGAALPDYPWAQVTTPPMCVDQPGHATYWSEQKYAAPANRILERRAIFQRPKYSGTLRLPLIIWAHPNGATDLISAEVNTRLAEPALQHGFAFMSVEFRHPVSSRPYEAPPPAPPDQNHNGGSPSPFCAYDSTDIATVVQWARLHAPQLMIDRQNIFLVGQSRGSLVLLTALMNDQIDVSKDPNTDYRAWPSKANAVFIANGQSTYDHAQLSQIFLRPWATAAESAKIINPPKKLLQFPLCRNGDNPPLFDYACQFDHADIVVNPRPSNPLSALDQLDAADPPVWARYDRTPPSTTFVQPLATVVPDAGTDQSKYIDQSSCYADAPGCMDVHHPNLGVALNNKYISLGTGDSSRAYVNVQYAATGDNQPLMDIADTHFYDNYYCFFQKYKPVGKQFVATITPNGDAQRLSAMQSYALNRDPSKDPPPPGGSPSCSLDASVPWNWNP